MEKGTNIPMKKEGFGYQLELDRMLMVARIGMFKVQGRRTILTFILEVKFDEKCTSY